MKRKESFYEPFNADLDENKSADELSKISSAMTFFDLRPGCVLSQNNFIIYRFLHVQ